MSEEPLELLGPIFRNELHVIAVGLWAGERDNAPFAVFDGIDRDEGVVVPRAYVCSCVHLSAFSSTTGVKNSRRKILLVGFVGLDPVMSLSKRPLGTSAPGLPGCWS
ncbi:MAG: hypothetical protein ACI9K5_003121 [Gammaproteobacteria bacterium]|jgi:hypothetical protein